jgi:phosphoribosylamine--glycine ligase
VLEKVFGPLLRTLKTRQIQYQGFLYAGLMLTDKGPYVLEFNVRLGDPETQAILMAMKGSLADILDATIAGALSSCEPLESECACVVVLASEGYPDAPVKGAVIEGLSQVHEAKIFHAGTRLEMGQFVVSGGRVLGVTASGQTPEEARQKAYNASEQIRFEGMQRRNDIGVF